MKFEIHNLGYIKQAEIELGDLTIICGKNNTGKTYVNYAIYGFLKTLKSNLDFEIENEVNQLLEQGTVKINLSEYNNKFTNSVVEFSKLYSKFLPQIFNLNDKLLQQANFTAKTDDWRLENSERMIANRSLDIISEEDDLRLLLSNFKKISILEISLVRDTLKVGNLEKAKKDTNKSTIEKLINQGLSSIFSESYFSDPFIITSERTGVSLFYKELDLNKTLMIDMMKNQINQNISFDFREILNKRTSRYSKPVQDEINFVRDLDIISKRNGDLAETIPEIIDLLTNIIGGDYSVTDYSMSFKFTEDNKQQEIPLYSASSTVKSLMNLYFYLKHLAKPGDILIIDEPELNLHPENQRKLAKLFARLTKCGLKLLMTTHSDYLIEELNNLIVFNNEFDNKSELMEKYGYEDQDVLDPDQVRVYIAENNTLNPAEITPLGIFVPTFDDEIKNMNDVYNKVTDNLDIAYDN
ncbi:MAG: AAA family ATPase [Crocosphaera sp.]|nr:AAA family ATPase [Crocosphaera sp.]